MMSWRHRRREVEPTRGGSDAQARADALLARATAVADAVEQHERDMQAVHVTIRAAHRRNGITEMVLRTLGG